MLGLLSMGRNGVGSNLAIHFDFFLFFPCQIFLSVDRSHLRRNTTIQFSIYPTTQIVLYIPEIIGIL